MATTVHEHGIPDADAITRHGVIEFQEAARKARLLRRLLQGTMGLEAQALSEEFLDALEQDTLARILNDDGHQLRG